MPRPQFLAVLLLLTPSAQATSDFLGATPLIDTGHHRVENAAQKLTADLSTDREKAVAIHRFVRDEIEYGFTRSFYEQKASAVLRSGRGFCTSKTTLFVALLRASGIPARQRFVELDVAILEGIVDPGTPWIDHSYAEVQLDGEWIAVDSYIVDPALFRSAQKQLRDLELDFGYGAHRHGTLEWDGRSPSFVQFVKSAPGPQVSRRNLGVHRDARAYYEANPNAWNAMNPAMRAFFWTAARPINKRIQSIRAGETTSTVSNDVTQSRVQF